MLLLDDDPGFRRALAANLREDGHRVHEFEHPSELPELDGLEDVHVLITDFCFEGGEDGLQFSVRFHSAYPSKPAILLTAYSDLAVDEHVGDLEYIRMLNKPLRYERLHDLLHHVIA